MRIVTLESSRAERITPQFAAARNTTATAQVTRPASDEELARKARELRASDPEITALAARDPNGAQLKALTKAARILGR